MKKETDLDLAQDFIGTGWGFPIKVNLRGGLSWSSGPPRIQDAMWIILNTAAGERIMRPAFGASVNDYVFQSNSEMVRAGLADAIRQALIKWEPRIELDGVRVEPDPDVTSQVLITIDYRLRGTNELFNMVYPLYLQEGVNDAAA